MAKEVETLRTNNSALQSALMANAQKLALMGDAESLKKDLENERTKRFGKLTLNKLYRHQNNNIFRFGHPM